VRRIAYGFLTREGMRKGELASLRWGDLDLERGRVKLDENKTDDPRAWALDPSVCAALAAWHAKSGKPDASAHVFAENGVPINTERLAQQLRRDLLKAQVLRPELQKGSKTRLALRAHDLRATFVTIALANGRSETFVADRTGHRSSQMISRYRRQARTWEEMGLGELVPLHLAIPELTELAVTERMVAPQTAPQNHKHGWRNGRRSGFRFHRREA
jgi:integrase